MEALQISIAIGLLIFLGGLLDPVRTLEEAPESRSTSEPEGEDSGEEHDGRALQSRWNALW